MRRAKKFLSSPTAPIGLVLGIAFLVLAIIGPIVWGHAGSRIDVNAEYQGPSTSHLLGTDALGRDVLARTLSATRESLLLAIAATAISALIGVFFGAVAALGGRRLRPIVSKAIVYSIGLPGILVALVVVTIASPGAAGATVGVGLGLSPLFARTAESVINTVNSQEYIASARALGVPPWILFRRYIMPNAAEPLILELGVAGSLALVSIAGLSYLGLGVQPPGYDWGLELTSGLQTIYTTPLAAVAPAFAITLAGMTFTLLGEAFARSMNPSLVPERRRLLRSVFTRDVKGTDGIVVPVMEGAGLPAALVSVRGLNVSFSSGGEIRPVVQNVGFDIHRGEILGVVGESGSGKSVTARAISGLLPMGAVPRAATMMFDGQETQKLGVQQRRMLFKGRLSMIFQDPMSSLNPALRIERQLTETLTIGGGVSRSTARDTALERLGEVGISAPRRRLRQYPHELSGGMRQRVMIAMGIMHAPDLIIADEPTTALDVTVQRQVIEKLMEIRAQMGTSILLISHDLALVSEVSDRVIIMYSGTIVEELRADDLAHAEHPYTRALLGAAIDLETDRNEPLVTISGRRGETAKSGCVFADRCALATDICRQAPVLEDLSNSHRVACWHATKSPIEDRHDEHAT